MNLEDFIKDLTPELQERARACNSVEELLALAKEAKVPVPDEALAAIAGGEDIEEVGCGKKRQCPNCGSWDTKFIHGKASMWHCNNCGYDFY